MAEIFISYARGDYKDKNGVIIPNNPISKIKEDLDKEGLSYWIDEDGIEPGKEWADLIPPAILRCKVFVFVSSQRSNEHKFTRSEVAIAHEYDKHIIPFRIDDTKYNPSIVVHLAGLEHISYYVDPERSVASLTQTIKNYIDEITNRAKKEREEIERQKRIQDIDKELKSQYEHKLSVENLIDERQKALSEVEEQRKEILFAIENLENNKKALSASGANSTNKTVNLGPVFMNQAKPLKIDRHFLRQVFKNCSRRQRIVLWSTIICLFCLMSFLLYFSVSLYLSEQESQRMNTMLEGSIMDIKDIAKQNLWKTDTLCSYNYKGNEFRYWNYWNFCNSRIIKHSKGDTLIVCCNLPCAIDSYNPHSYGQLKINIGSKIFFDSSKDSLNGNFVKYVFEQSGTDTINGYYSHDNFFYPNGKLYINLIHKNPVLESIKNECEKYIKNN